jgi:hypothetical protein
LAERVGPDITILGLPAEVEFGAIPNAVEFDESVEAIAVAKAIWYSRHIPLKHILATDGNLLVSSLKPTWNPVYTSRFAGLGASGRTRATTLLEAARNLQGMDRRIGWTEALAVARDGKLLRSWVADSPPGELATDLPPDMDDSAGFWVPYVWRCPEYDGRRLSELRESERLARRDHWAILGQQITEWCRHQHVDSNSKGNEPS